MHNSNSPPNINCKVFTLFENNDTKWFLGMMFWFLTSHKSSVKAY